MPFYAFISIHNNGGNANGYVPFFDYNKLYGTKKNSLLKILLPFYYYAILYGEQKFSETC